ncbi:hypothetical protein ACIP4X_05240 [Streptomyces sp. NPDC088817]|uniref:hypothetical protein n=1 Tax=Streptomyces sp. NPDC088817 TaxID=3365907 RepID=UPI00382EFAE7
MFAIKFLISLCALPVAIAVSALIILYYLTGAAAGLLIGAPILALSAALGDKGDTNGLADWIAKGLKATVHGPVEVFENIYGSIWNDF